MIDYTQILILHYSDKQWTLNGDSYEGLNWLSESPKPTKEVYESFRFAFFTKKMRYSNSLIYSEDVEESMNNSIFEPNL